MVLAVIHTDTHILRFTCVSNDTLLCETYDKMVGFWKKQKATQKGYSALGQYQITQLLPYLNTLLNATLIPCCFNDVVLQIANMPHVTWAYCNGEKMK